MTRILTAIAGSLLLAAAAVVAQPGAQKEHVTSADAVTFTPLDPKNPGGINVSVVSGDLMGKAPVTFFMRLPKGPAPLHAHSAGYHATIIRGQAKHWPAGAEKAAKVLGPGSHWYQPGKANHGDECLSDECLLLIQMDGGFDFIPAQK
jgi:hypothetical protein